MRDRLERTYPRQTERAALPALAGIVMALCLALGAPAHAQDAPGNTPMPTATISTLSFSGNSAFGGSQLQRAMGISVSGWFSRGDTFSKARLAGALANLRSFYISRGYLRFAVKQVMTTPSADGKTVTVAVVVDEGRRYGLASVKLTGDADNLTRTPGVSEALQRALPIGRPVSREGLDAARRAITAQLNHDGYPQAGISARFTTDDQNARIALTFEITRSGQPPVPNSPVQTSPVRESAIAPVTPVAPVAPISSAPPPPQIAAGPKLPQGKPSPAQPVATQPPTAPPKTAAAPQPPVTPPAQPDEQKLDPADQRQINLGASVGYSSADRLIAMANARYLNAFGKGRDLGVSIAGGKSYRAASLTESDRYFTRGGTSRATSLWYRADQPFYYLNRSRFRTSGMGLTERFDIPLTAANSVYLAPGAEHDWMGPDSLTPQAYRNYINRHGSTLNVATLGAGWTHDMRDSASLPTRGYIAQANAELGVGNAYYLKTYASARYYHPLWRDTVLSVSGLGGFGQGFGSQGYPIEKYFYAGGIGSVRGYATNSLGSRDPGTGFPLGGRRLLTGSVEAITPITSFQSDKIPGRPVWLLFVDGGNVWSSGLGGTSAGAPRFSYGAGLGWQIPFGTLKLDFALPITHHAGDDYQKFQVEFNAGF